MSNQSKKLKTHHFTEKGFCGVEFGKQRDNASRVCNFRIMPDGSIMKRPGFKKISELPGVPSYFGIFNISSEKVGLAVIGNKIFEVNLKSGEYAEYFDSLEAEAESCTIISYNENLFVFDGKKPKRLNGTTLTDFEGYAPLYGKDWHPILRGAVHEPLNLVSSHYRVNYALSSDTDKIRLPSDVVSIDRVEINGSAIFSDEYTFDSSQKYVTSNLFASEGGSATFWVTYNRSGTSGVAECHQALSVSSGNGSVVFCYGRNSIYGVYCYRSSVVSKESFRESEKVYMGNVDLYFPSTSAFTVGSGTSIIRSVLPYDGRVIVFSDNGAWLVPLKDDIIAESLNRTVGCVSPFASVYCGDSPYTVCGNRLFLWSETLEPYSPFNADCISAHNAIPSWEDPQSTKLFVNSYENELWIFNSSGSSSDIVIYNYERKQWYSFSGFSPCFAFEAANGEVGFVEGSAVCLFDSESTYDTREAGIPTPIEATYVSSFTKIDRIGRIKHADRIIVDADSGSNGNLHFHIMYDTPERTVSISSTSSIAAKKTQIFSQRLPHTRFRKLRFYIVATGISRERIFDVALDYTIDDGNY